MRCTSWTAAEAEADFFGYGFIHDWYTLGARIMVPPYKISYALRERDDLQQKIRLQKGKRVVYKSIGPLAEAQRKLVPMLYELDKAFTPKTVLSYRRGVDPKQDLKAACTAHKYTVHFDIRKYFDSITMDHIVRTLQACGMSRSGAKLVSRLCCVSPAVSGLRRTALQQGSPVSPLISNLVGAIMFDGPLQQWWADKAEATPGLEYEYRRYCDNVLVCVDGAVTMDLLREYKAFAKDLMQQNGFATHDWATIPSYHPKRNQKFLGIVLNERARVENDVYDRLSAILFNCCCYGRASQMERFHMGRTVSASDAEHTEIVSEDGYTKYGQALPGMRRWGNREHIRKERFTSVIRGNISYVKSVSEEQGTKLEKLYTAMQFLDGVRDSSPETIGGQGASLPKKVHAAVKTYRDKTVSTEEYVKRLQQAVIDHQSAA